MLAASRPPRGYGTFAYRVKPDLPHQPLHDQEYHGCGQCSCLAQRRPQDRQAHLIQLQPVCFTWGCGRRRTHRGYCSACLAKLRREEDVQPYDPSVFREHGKCSKCHNRVAHREGKCLRCHRQDLAATPEYKQMRAVHDRAYHSKPEVKRKRRNRERARRLADRGITRNSFQLIS